MINIEGKLEDGTVIEKYEDLVIHAGDGEVRIKYCHLISCLYLYQFYHLFALNVIIFTGYPRRRSCSLFDGERRAVNC